LNHEYVRTGIPITTKKKIRTKKKGAIFPISVTYWNSESSGWNKVSLCPTEKVAVAVADLQVVWMLKSSPRQYGGSVRVLSVEKLPSK